MNQEVVKIASESLSAAIKIKGAELCSLVPKSHQKELIWQADPNIWEGQAPVLFPIIGCLKDGFMTHSGQSYRTPKHGIVRHNQEIEVISQSPNEVVFELKSSAQTKVLYPFDFNFRISYKTEGNRLIVDHAITNEGEDLMLFSLGAHPAFNAPLFDGDTYDDHYLEFPELESSHTWKINDEGLINGIGHMVLNNTSKLPLSHALFLKDALVLKDLKSRSAKLVSSNKGAILEMTYDGFPYLGIWAKPNGDFVCIEPWQGIADTAASNHVFASKEGIRALKAGSTFRTSYAIKAY